MESAWVTPASHLSKEAASEKMVRSSWSAVTLRVENQPPFRMRSTW